jgi:hypothetical protein
MIKGSERKPTGQPRFEAVGPWGGGAWGSGPELCGSSGGRTGSGRIYRDRRSPERVWTLGSVTLLVLPMESLPAALTVKGAGGGQTAGQPPIQQPGQNQTALGQRALGLKNQEGSLGEGDSRGERRRGRGRWPGGSRPGRRRGKSGDR